MTHFPPTNPLTVIYMARIPRTPAAMPKLPPSIAPIVGAAPLVATGRVVVEVMDFRMVVIGVVCVDVDVDVEVRPLRKLSLEVSGESNISVEVLKIGVSLGVGIPLGTSVVVGCKRVVNDPVSSFAQVCLLVQ